MKAFQILIFSLIFLFTSKNVSSQELVLKDTIEFDFCNELLNRPENSIFQLSLIYKLDTILFPRLSEKIFLNPIKLYNLEIDTTQKHLEVLFENTKYIYYLRFRVQWLTGDYTYLCIEKRKRIYSRGRYGYFIGGYITAFSFCERTKKNRRYPKHSISQFVW
ncbi:MAG: hypothetical protein ABI207_02540 [Crocinitomicaceae bacterium]